MCTENTPAKNLLHFTHSSNHDLCPCSIWVCMPCPGGCTEDQSVCVCVWGAAFVLGICWNKAYVNYYNLVPLHQHAVTTEWLIAMSRVGGRDARSFREDVSTYCCRLLFITLLCHDVATSSISCDVWLWNTGLDGVWLSGSHQLSITLQLHICLSISKTHHGSPSESICPRSVPRYLQRVCCMGAK